MPAPQAAGLAIAIQAIQATAATVPSITGAGTATLALLKTQIAAAQILAQQVLSFYDNSLAAAGNPADFVSGTPPVAMIANITALSNAQAGINAATDCVNKLGRLAINVAQVISPTSQVADLSHTYGNDLDLTPTGDIATVSGYKRTVQRVIRRLCTTRTRAGAGSGNLTVAPGDDLFRIAAEQYGNATGWSLIAAANDLSDPLIQDDQVIAIPPWNAARANDGILPLPTS